MYSVASLNGTSDITGLVKTTAMHPTPTLRQSGI